MRRVWHDGSGNVTMLFAGALAMLSATATLGVDAGLLFVEKRRVQGLADAAALAGAAAPGAAREAAAAALALTGGAPVTLDRVEGGSYVADPAIDPAARFRPGAIDNAVRVRVTSVRRPMLGRVLGLDADVPISAEATAARVAMAGFSVGSRLAAVEGGLPGALLSALAGSDLRLSVLDYRALVAGRVDLLRCLDALRTQLHLEGANYSEVLAAQVRLPQLLTAAADAADGAATRDALRTLALRVPPTEVTLAALIDLGALGEGYTPGIAPALSVEAFALVRAMLAGDRARTIELAAAAGLPGLADMKVRIALGGRTARSPWLAVGGPGGMTVRTDQARVLLDVRLADALPLLGAVRVPLYVELASAEARLSAVDCSRGRAQAAATLSVTPSLGRIAIADLDPHAFADHSRAPALRPAELLRAPLLAVTGSAEAVLGGRSRAVTFSAADIAAQTPRTVGTDDIATSLAGSLVERLALNTQVLGLGLDVGLLVAPLKPLLAGVAAPLDTLLNHALATAGVGLGQADSWVHGVRCGTPILVG